MRNHELRSSAGRRSRARDGRAARRGALRRAAAALCLALPLGCAAPGPVEGLFAFLDALAGPSAEAPYRLLDRQTRERLGAHAAALRTQSGGAVDRRPEELIAYLGVGMKRDRRAVSVLREEAELAVLRVPLEGGGHEDLTVRREDGKWRVSLSLEAAAPAAAPAATGPKR